MATAAIPLAGYRNEAPDPEPAPAAAPAASARAEAPAGPTREEFEALRRELDETRGSNRQLMDLVGRTAPKAAAAAPAVAEDDDIDWGQDPADDPADPNAEPEDPAAVVEDISRLGAAALEKRGFVRRADVQKMVREESRKAAITASRQVVQKARTQATTESSIMQEFPDLADQNSDLFKATIPHVQAAARFNPKAATDPVTLYLAAKAAKAELAGRRGSRDDDGDEPAPRRSGRREADDVDDRSEREIRIASQQGDRGRTRSRIETGGDEFVMSDDARAVARAMGISDDDYKAEANRIRPAAAQRGRR